MKLRHLPLSVEFGSRRPLLRRLQRRRLAPDAEKKQPAFLLILWPAAAPARRHDEQDAYSAPIGGAAVVASVAGAQHRTAAALRLFLQGKRRIEIWCGSRSASKLRPAAPASELE